MYKNLKRTTASMLALLFLILTPIQSFALGKPSSDEISPREINKEFIEKMSMDAGEDITYLTKDEFSKIENIQSDKHSYFTEYESNGAKNFAFKEGANLNILTIDKNGDVFLDQEPVIVETTNLDNGKSSENQLKSFIDSNRDIQPYAKRRFFWLKLPNGLTDANLPIHTGNFEKTISFGSRLMKDLASGAFFTIIGAALGGVPGSIIGLALGAVYSAAKSGYPRNNALSVRGAKRKGHNVGGYLLIEKIYTEYYGNSNYTGYLGNSVHYLGYDD